jgi:hypothetical protein
MGMPANPISSDLAVAFGAAVEYFTDHWTASNPDALVFIGGRAQSIRSVCELVGHSEDSLPEDVQKLLFAQMHAEDYALRFDLTWAGSYRLGAQCLLKLMDDRIAAEELRQQRHWEASL